MAAQNPPYVIQGQSHPADGFRRGVKALREAAGVVLTADMAVTQNGSPNMSVNVAAGQAVIDGTENATLQGSYEVTNDATVNLAIAASDPTNPRNDLVVAKVQDSNYSGGTQAWSLAVVTGTPAGSPVDPATPANAIVLARVRVDATVTSIVNAKITDLRAYAHGSILPGTTGFTIFDSTGALKQATTDDNGLWTFRNALKVPPSKDGTLAPSGYGAVPIKIDDQLLGVAAASVIFVNPLPTGFRHLLIEWYARGDTASTVTTLAIRFNNDSTNTTDRENARISANAAVSGAETLTQSSISIGIIPAATATAAYFGSGEAKVKHYQSTTGNKQVFSQYTFADSDATGHQEIGLMGGKWRTTATAITRVDILCLTGNFVAGSLFTLWGFP